MHRLLVPDAAPGPVKLEGARFHYVARVLRLGEGDTLEVFDGQGHVFDARVMTRSDASVTLEVGEVREAAMPRRLIVVQGLPKGDKLEWVLQKGTELGVQAFAPVACARSVVKLDAKASGSKLVRWQRIVEEAARQCGRADVPQVAAPRPLLEAVTALGAEARVFVLDEAERVLALSEAFASMRDDRRPVALVIGPEGGLTREEVAALVAHGAVPVTLGRRVLRTETAALAAVSVLQHLDGDLG